VGTFLFPGPPGFDGQAVHAYYWFDDGGWKELHDTGFLYLTCWTNAPRNVHAVVEGPPCP
jgi:hypothetical protein